MAVPIMQQSLSGDNAGEITVDNGKLSMFNPSGQMFSAQMSNITQVSSTKNEVSLQFKRGEGISCTAMKFHVLSAQDADTFKAEEVAKKIKLSHEGNMEQTELIRLEDVQILAPRGKFNIIFLQKCIKIVGKSFDFILMLDNIDMMACLPLNEKNLVNFVIRLKSPLKHGQSFYEFICMVFQKSNHLPLVVSMSDAELSEKYGGQLADITETKTHTATLTQLFEGFLNMPVGGLHDQIDPIQCCKGANTGNLYFLKDGIFFEPKSFFYITYSQIEKVAQIRESSDGKYFDAQINSIDKKSFVLSNILATSNRSFFAFLNSMGVTCESFGGISDQQANNDSESSEEENESESDNEEESDDDISE